MQKKIIQLKPLIMITLGQAKSDTTNQTITISISYWYKLLFKRLYFVSMGRFDHINQKIYIYPACLEPNHFLTCMYSQTCVQRPPLGPGKRGRYAEGYIKKISGK